MNEKSGQENGKAFPKTDARYWKDRLFKAAYTKKGERFQGQTWSARFQLRNRREVFNLQTSNATAAATKAANIYKKLLAVGWDEVLSEHKPKEQKAPIQTVGDFVKVISATKGKASPQTMRKYVECFRRIAADIALVDRDEKSKFDYFSGAHAIWVEKVEAVPLGAVTTQKIREWMHESVAGAKDPLEMASRKTSANSTVAQAKALWSPKRLKQLEPEVRQMLETVNPFAELEMFEGQDTTYRAKFQPGTLLAMARDELGVNEDKEDEWLSFVLFLFAGLRRREIDLLIWPSVDLNMGVVRVETTRYFRPKTKRSEREIYLPDEVTSLLKEWRAGRPDDVFVVRSTRDFDPKATDRRYRCQKVFDSLMVWMRSKGIGDFKPLHTMRKAAGDEINRSHGLLAASRFLGHSSITVTAAHYADGRGATVGLGSVLAKKVEGRRQ